METVEIASIKTQSVDVFSDTLFEGVRFDFSRSVDEPDYGAGSHSDVISNR
jgi:hypothetical protein